MGKFQRKGNLEHKLRIFRSSNFKHKMKKLQIPQRLVNENFYGHEKILRTRNCRCKFIKNFLTEKNKENIKPNNRHLHRD